MTDIEPYDENEHSVATKTLRRDGRRLEQRLDLEYISQNQDAARELGHAIKAIQRAIYALEELDDE